MVPRSAQQKLQVGAWGLAYRWVLKKEKKNALNQRKYLKKLRHVFFLTVGFKHFFIITNFYEKIFPQK